MYYLGKDVRFQDQDSPLTICESGMVSNDEVAEDASTMRRDSNLTREKG